MENSNCCSNHEGLWKDKGDMFKVLTLFLLITTIFMVFKTIGAYKQNAFIGQEMQNVISFNGHGEVTAVADVATFTFSVTEEAATTVKAQDASAKKINAIMKYLKDQGIEDKDIKTAGYSVYPRYEYQNQPCSQYYCPEGERTLKGYEVSQTITVKVRETDNAGKLLSGVGELGATNISGVEFSIDDEEGLKRDARKIAIEDAQKQAEELADDLGVNLVRIIGFNETGNYPVYAMYDKAMGMGGGPEIAVAPEIPKGENTITSDITITYQIK